MRKNNNIVSIAHRQIVSCLFMDKSSLDLYCSFIAQQWMLKIVKFVSIFFFFKTPCDKSNWDKVFINKAWVLIHCFVAVRLESSISHISVTRKIPPIVRWDDVYVMEQLFLICVSDFFFHHLLYISSRIINNDFCFSIVFFLLFMLFKDGVMA